MISRLAYALLACSLLLNLSFVKAYPSYNDVLALTTWFYSLNSSSLDFSYQIPLLGSIQVLATSTFILDILFIILWSGEIVESDDSGFLVKTLFGVFVLNMALKLFLSFTVTTLQVQLFEQNEEHEKNKKKDIGVDSHESESGNILYPLDAKDDFKTPRNDSKPSSTFDFTPGIPGLLSP